MIDIDINHYYKAFINNAKNDIEKYQHDYNVNRDMLLKIKDEVKDYKTHLEHEFKLYLVDDFPNSWNNTTYDANEHFTKIIRDKLNFASGKNRITLLQLLRYSELLKTCDDFQKRIAIAKERSNITCKQYKEYLKRYYMQGVHKALIEGFAYRFGFGVGDLLINFWKYVKETNHPQVDWAATNKRKKEILDAGLKLYNKEEAEIYKLRGLKYDGVPYVVHKTNKEFFNIELINCKAFNKKYIKFKHANYIPGKFRGKTVPELAEMFNSVSEIAVQDLGIRHKLITCLEKDSSLYLNYIRNVDQVRQHRGEHTTKNSKRAELD